MEEIETETTEQNDAIETVPITTIEYETLIERLQDMAIRLNTIETIVNELQVQNDIDTTPDSGIEPGTEPIGPIEPEPAAENTSPTQDQVGDVRRPNRKHWYFRSVKLW